MRDVSALERPAAELIREALAADAANDEDRRWRFVSELQSAGGEPALSLARELCQSEDPTRRRLGADVLGQLGTGDGRSARDSPFRDAAVGILLQAIDREEDPDVLASIGVGFGHLHDPRCIPALARLRTHPDPDVRHAVAFGLLGRPERAALDVLIELSADPNAEVRDWATFGLAR